MLSALLLVLVIALHCWLVWVGPFPGDRWAARQAVLISTRPQLLRDFTRGYEYVGTPDPAIVLVVLMVLAVWRFSGGRAAAGLVIACVAVAVNALLKTIFGPTPLWVELHHSGVNFPSGHVTFVTATFGYVAVVAAGHRQTWLAAVALVLVVGVGPARVLGGDHLVSDVIGGYLLGAAGLIVGYTYMSYRTTTSEENRRCNTVNWAAPV